MQLDGPVSRLLSDALCDAFNRSELEQLLSFELNRSLATITLGNNLRQIVFELIQTANRQNWADQLILAARRYNPANDKLFMAAQAADLATEISATRGLEKIVREAGSFLDVAIWRSRLAELEGRVCRVEVPTNDGMSYGTGFLVSGDAVMTNYHVMEPLIEEKGEASHVSSVRLRFDYRVTSDGATVHQGVLCRLKEEDWLIDASPYDPLDLQPNPPGAPRPKDRLDYALLRLGEALGTAPIGGALLHDVPPRGFIRLPKTDELVKPKQPIFILQHPEAAPLKLAFETEGILSVNENRTRLRYSTNTLRGSSGSPCFDANWNLVALHHIGDPRWRPGNRGDYNQGIPITAIRQLLQERGKLGSLVPE